MTLELVDRLVERLNSSGTVYCHWKSNFYLDQASSGGTDLDFLVERGSLSRALDILLDLGFKPAVVKWGRETPGTFHHYGFDRQTGDLVHVHLLSCVLTGESFVKSHLLPLGPMLLENTGYIDQTRVTSRPAELVLFVLRTFIKYGSLPDLILLLRNGEEVRSELRWLKAGGDVSEALRLLKEHCPVMDEALFIKCIDTLDGPSSLIKRLVIARQVRRRLRVYARYTGFARILAYGQWLWGQGQRRLTGNKQGKLLCVGGAVVAVVGPDASGKSTLVSECGRWLGSAFAVSTVHAGKPPSSFLTAPVNIVLPVVRRLLPRLRTGRLEARGVPTNPNRHQSKAAGLPSLIYALRAVTVAWDRRRLLVKARRSAANGEIVVCDRYPSEVVGVMDSPRLRADLTRGGLLVATYNWLARLEGRLYRQIPPPDVVLRLKASIGTTQTRNRERTKVGKGRDTDVASRHRQSQEWHRRGSHRTYDVDTEQSLADTILDVKKAIWESV